jgi:hypothetical protein
MVAEVPPSSMAATTADEAIRVFIGVTFAGYLPALTQRSILRIGSRAWEFHSAYKFAIIF